MSTKETPNPMPTEPKHTVGEMTRSGQFLKIQSVIIGESFGSVKGSYEANAARLVAGWNLLNRLDEMGVDAEQVPEIVESLQWALDELQSVSGIGYSQRLSDQQMMLIEKMTIARQALTKKG